MFKVIRIVLLLFVLTSVALGAWRTQTRSVEWKYALPINLYLINGDGSSATSDYLQTLTVDDFRPIETFMRDEAGRYGHNDAATVQLRIGNTIASTPPAPPVNGNVLQTIIWSLNLRWWAYRLAETTGPGPQARMFLLYYDPATNARLDHSLAMQKGLIGRVKLFASHAMDKQNCVIVAHEFLHTLGATDKYDLANNQPLFPDGYAEPDRTPLLPQRYAEIMAGRTPLTQSEAVTPRSLSETVIGAKTAREINWW